MNPLATYCETRLDGQRTFALFEDRVVVRGKTTLRASFETSTPLAPLAPSFARIRLRNKAFFAGMWIAVGFSILAYIVRVVSQKDPTEAVYFLGFMGFAGVFVMLVTARKVEWVTFHTDAGVAVLSIARAGKEKDKFYSFIEAITNQIRATKGRALS